MGWDGSGTVQRTDGTRTGATTWAQAKSAGATVNAADHDSHDEDLADAIENCIARDGQNTPSADLPMGGRKHTGVADATAADQYAAYGQLSGLAPPFVPAADVGGTANGITLGGVSPSPASYAAGKGYRFVVEAENTGAVTLKEGTKAAISLRRADGSEMQGGEMQVGMHVTAVYNGANFISDVQRRVWVGTKAQYDALTSKRAGVIYLAT